MKFLQLCAFVHAGAEYFFYEVNMWLMERKTKDQRVTRSLEPRFTTVYMNDRLIDRDYRNCAGQAMCWQ